jgi:hypothetical protein
VRELVDDIILVSEQEIERAVSLLINIEKTVVEGAGAAGLAAVLKEPGRFKGRVLGLVLCGGNIDTRLLASVLARELAREGRLTQLAIDWWIGRGSWPRSPTCWARWAPTSSRSTTSASFPTCRPRPRCWSS